MAINEERILYNDINYPKKGYNFTVGMLAELTYGPFFPNPGGIYHIFGTICTLYKYNNGEGPINITGSLNYQGVNTKSEALPTYYEAMQLLKTNLYSKSNQTQQQLQTIFPAPMGALIGAGSFSAFLSVSPYFAGFRIPTISYTALPNLNPAGSLNDDIISPVSQSVFSISPSSSPFLFGTIESFLLQMNWTLVGALFEASIFGGLGVTSLENMKATVGLNFVCSDIFSVNLNNDQALVEGVKRFNKCVKNFNTVSVILLWMSFSSAARVIKEFEDLGYTSYTFIVAYREDSSFEFQSSSSDILAYNFFFRTAADLPSQEEIDTCISRIITGNERTETYFLTFLAEYYRLNYDCELYSNNATLPSCSTKEGIRDGQCLCAIHDILKTDNQTYRYSFAADAVSTIAYALDLLVNNCTYLNSVKFTELDFCAKDTFTLTELSEAISAVYFEGFTGPISFFDDTLLRKTAVYEVLQFNGTSNEIIVGTSRTGGEGLVINFDSITFRNGKTPISEIVTQIPDLSDALVIIFFSLFIVELVVAFVLIFWVFWNRNNKALRRKSPLFLALILLGVVLVLSSGIIMSVGLSSPSMCIIYIFLLVLGLTLIISCLMAKNWRIYRIFNNAEARAIDISDHNLLLFPVVLILASLALLFIYCFAGGTLELRIVQGFSNTFYVFEICSSPSSWFQTFFIILFYVYFIILFALTATIAFYTRHANNQFRESKAIARIIYIYLCMGIIFIPLYYVQGKATNSQDTRFAIVSINIFILMLATMVILFIPEIVAVRRANKRASRAED